MENDTAANDGATLREMLLRTVERRALALGKFYTDVQLSDEQVRKAEEAVRFARMWEQQRVRNSMRRAELNVERQILLDAERPGNMSVEKAVGAIARDLRAQAMVSLEAVALATRAQLQVLERGDERWLLKQHSGTVERDKVPVSVASTPRVALNVDLGGGDVERVVLSDGDDVNEVAAAFVHRHGLPQHAIQILAEQARAALEEQQQQQQHHH